MPKQKIIKIGNSLGITLPSNLVHSLSIKQGDTVKIEQHSPETITINFVDSHQLAFNLSSNKNNN